MRYTFKIISLSFLLILSACAPFNYDYRYRNFSSEEFINKNQMAADNLSKQLLDRSKNSATISPVIVSSVVNMNALQTTSSFGRLVTEQISARFSQLKYNVVELKLKNDILVKNNQGEFLLSRELKDIAQSAKAEAVVVGTYVENTNDVFVTLKVVRPTNNIVLAGYSYAIPKAANIKGMLND